MQTNLSRRKANQQLPGNGCGGGAARMIPKGAQGNYFPKCLWSLWSLSWCCCAGVKTCWTAYFSCMQVICVSYALIKIFKQVTKDQYKSGLQVSLPLLHKGYFISCLWISLASLVSTSHSSLAGQVAGDRNNLLSTLAKVLLGNQVLPCTTNTFEWVTLLLWVCFFICETKVCQPFKQTSAREAVSLFVNWVLAAYWCVTCFCKASGFLFCVARVQT